MPVFLSDVACFIIQGTTRRKMVVVLHEPPDDVSLHTVDAFWKSTNTEYSGDCHSSDCSMMIRSVAMWSVQDLSWRNPACSSRRFTSRAFLSLSRMILVRILLGMELNLAIRSLGDTGSQKSRACAASGVMGRATP